MPRMEIDTSKKLYSPIEVVIDGEIYTVEKVTPGILEVIDVTSQQALQGDVNGIYRQLKVLAGVPEDVCKKVDVRTLNEVLDFIITSILNPEKKETAKEKKAGKPRLKNIKK